MMDHLQIARNHMEPGAMGETEAEIQASSQIAIAHALIAIAERLDQIRDVLAGHKDYGPPPEPLAF